MANPYIFLELLMVAAPLLVKEWEAWTSKRKKKRRPARRRRR